MEDKLAAPIVCLFAIIVFGVSGWVFDNDSFSDMARGAAAAFETIAVCVAFTSMGVMLKDVFCQLAALRPTLSLKAPDVENVETPLLEKATTA